MGNYFLDIKYNLKKCTLKFRAVRKSHIQRVHQTELRARVLYQKTIFIKVRVIFLKNLLDFKSAFFWDNFIH